MKRRRVFKTKARGKAWVDEVIAVAILYTDTVVYIVLFWLITGTT